MHCVAIGTTRKSRDVRGRSASRRIADVFGAIANVVRGRSAFGGEPVILGPPLQVRFVPEAEIVAAPMPMSALPLAPAQSANGIFIVPTITDGPVWRGSFVLPEQTANESGYQRSDLIC